MFVSGGTLYYASRTDHDLRKVSFSNGTVSGTPTVVSGPTVDGVDWSNRAMFLSPGAPNNPPTAAFTSSCTNLSCTFNGSGSSDSNGSITSYAWDFGDSHTDTGVTPPAHAYASAGTYTVSLTVTDNGGATSSVTHTVTVSAANAKPTAAFTSSCTNLSCTFNGSGSSDSDGSITSYAWDFGDSHTDTGVTPPAHAYASAGTYTVSLTVTDNGGATDSVSHSVTVSSGGSGIGFVAAANAGGGNVKNKSVAIPAAAHAGDTAVLFLSQPATAPWSGPSGVTGWTQVGSNFTNGGLTTTVWTKQLSAGDVGANVQFSSPNFSHAAVEVAVYSGVSGVGNTATAQDTNASSHTTAAINASAGSWVVSLWSDRSTATRTWATPGSVSQRDASPDSGNLTIQGVVADSGGSVSSGTYPGVTATTDANTDRTAMWTIELDAA
jgi:PKD repeat protein